MEPIAEEMKVTWAELIAPDEIHGDMGPASVVMNHIVTQLAASRNVQKAPRHPRKFRGTKRKAFPLYPVGA